MKSVIRLIITASILLVLIFYASSIISISLYSPQKTDIKPSQYVLGSEEYGNVVKDGPYGNTSSPVKIAFVVGVHPLEENAHKASVEALKKYDKRLRYCYYIYHVNVTQDAYYYITGRNYGQHLASEYAVPDIKKENFQLVMDIHSQEGVYSEEWFLNVPEADQESEKIANELLLKIPGIAIYNPPSPTSPYYVTMPLIESGTPALIYETYTYEDYSISLERAEKLLLAIDSLSLNPKYGFI